MKVAEQVPLAPAEDDDAEAEADFEAEDDDAEAGTDVVADVDDGAVPLYCAATWASSVPLPFM